MAVHFCAAWNVSNISKSTWRQIIAWSKWLYILNLKDFVSVFPQSKIIVSLLCLYWTKIFFFIHFNEVSICSNKASEIFLNTYLQRIHPSAMFSFPELAEHSGQAWNFLLVEALPVLPSAWSLAGCSHPLVHWSV